MLSLSLKQKVLWIATGIVLSTAVLMMATHRNSDRAEGSTTDHVHGNSDRNDRLHIVYEIFGIDDRGNKQTIKYGISCQHCFVTRDGNPRPEYQIAPLQLVFPFIKVQYVILHRNIPSRTKAKELERKYVTDYVKKYNDMPLRQTRPKPIQ